MSAHKSLPEEFKIAQMTAGPVTTNGGVTSDTISLKNANKAWIIVDLTQAVGHATAVVLRQATDVANGTTAAGPTCRCWLNEDTAATDTLVAQTAGATVTVTNDIKKKQLVIEVDPATLTDGYDCMYFTIATSGQATNFVNAIVLIDEKYQQATPPSAILD